MPAVTPLAPPDVVAFFGDWHTNTHYAVAALEHAAAHGADVGIHVGDFGGRFPAGYLASVTRACNRVGMNLLFVDGTHDDHQQLARLPLNRHGIRPLDGGRIFHLPRGFRWTWHGRRFLALGGAHSVDGPTRRRSGLLWQPEEETISTADARRAVAGPVVDVLVSHDCPAGVDIPGLAAGAHRWPADQLAHADTHRRLLRSVVDVVQPVHIVHGHYHRRYTLTVDLGYGPVHVHGLAEDGCHDLADNVHVVRLADLARRV